MPAEAGIQKCLKILDSRLLGNDANVRFQTFYEGIKFESDTEMGQKGVFCKGLILLRLIDQ